MAIIRVVKIIARRSVVDRSRGYDFYARELHAVGIQLELTAKEVRKLERLRVQRVNYSALFGRAKDYQLNQQDNGTYIFYVEHFLEQNPFNTSDPHEITQRVCAGVSAILRYA